VRTILETPPIPQIVPGDVFDAFGWTPSRRLEWRAPDDWSRHEPLTADNPPRMVFVMKRDLPFLPRELARFHAPGLGLAHEWALAPYGIDDATDGLYEHAVAPHDAFWLAADSLRGLFWGLHDWAHFHSHGPFTQRAATELQCDASALAWLWTNRQALGIDEPSWEATRAQASQIGAARFAEEGADYDARLLDGARIKSWT
jgi:hypothetical protein